MPQYIVIFKAQIQQLDAEYQATAQRMRDKAISDYGCVSFIAMNEGDQEIALSYWNNLEDIALWKKDVDHQDAQRMGATKWYQRYQVEIARIQRSYSSGNA